MRFVYYVTSHGYGHGTRSAAVMNALLARQPGLELHVRTGVPEWVFRNSIAGAFHYANVTLDAGMVERGLLAQDAPTTLRRCQEISHRAPEIVSSEVAFIRDQRIDCIVSDIPPLASLIAREAGVPVVAIGNFSWDYIYATFAPPIPDFVPVIDEIRGWYGSTDLLLRLPWSHEMEGFPVRESLPLVARAPSDSVASTREKLSGAGVNVTRPLILLAGRFPDLLTTALRDVLDSGRFSVLGYTDPGVGDSPNFTLLDEPWQPKFLEVLHASDVAVSKLGYGIASECVACRTRILYPPREQFAEHPFIEADLPLRVPTQRIERAEFEAGAWVAPLETLLAQPLEPLNTPINGAEVAAARILSFAVSAR